MKIMTLIMIEAVVTVIILIIIIVMIVCYTKSKLTIHQAIDDHYMSYSNISFNSVSSFSHHYFFIAQLKILS